MTDEDPRPTLGELQLQANLMLNGRGQDTAPVAVAPQIGASPLELRIYLTAAFGLVLGYHVGRIERHGPYGTDSVAIEILTPDGPHAVRFDRIDDIASPKILRQTIATALGGVTMMRAIKGPEAYDVLLAVLRLAVVEHATHLEDTRDTLEEYAAGGDRLVLPFATPEDRYNSLGALKARAAFGRERAGAFLHGSLREGERWAVIIDAANPVGWIRKGEFLTYLRHVMGLPNAPSRTWDAKVREAGGEFVTKTADGRTRSGHGKRHELKLYRLPEPVLATL